MALSLHAVTIVVPDYNQAIAFYVDLLGFTLVADERISETKRWVLVAPDPAGPALLLARADGADQSAAIGNQTGGRVGFFLTTDNFDATHARMRSAGVHFEEPPRHEPYGTVAVWQDPFGNRWDLLELIERP